jgi:tetratricopeptide (TPR) repeat protein
MQDYNRRFNDNDSCWLIKIDTRISGPFSFNEVLAKLTSGEIYSHHEVMQPLDRWRSLVAQPLFAAAVEKLKRQMELTPEQTMTKTERTSFTRTLDLHSDRVTPTPFVNTITPPPQPVSGHPLENSPTGGIYRGPTKKTNSWPLIGIAVVGVIAAFVFVYPRKSSQTTPQKQHSNFISFVDRGLANKKIGEWYEALKNFKQAYQLNNKDIDLTFEITPLLVQIENQTMYARSLMEKILPGQYKKENLSMGKNIIGLTYSFEGNTKAAIKAFDDALDVDDSYTPAMINRGFALLIAGKYSEAENQLRQALNAQSDNAIAAFYLLEAYIIDGQKNNDMAAYDKAIQLSNQLLARRIYDGQQEILLFQAYATFKRGTGNSAGAVAEAILQKSLAIDPDQTSDHLHSPLVDWRGYNWKYFSFICKDFSKALNSDTISLLEFTCAYKMNHETGAQQAVELLVSRMQNSPIPQVAQAIVSYHLGEFEKAKDSLGLAQKLGAKDKLYLQVLIKVCGKLRDTNCIRQNLEKVAQVAPLHASVAKIFERTLSSEDRNQVIQNGLRESRNYAPLIKLQ